VLIFCIFVLLFFFSCVWIHRACHQPTLKNRCDVAVGEQNPSANPTVLDAVMSDNPA